MVKKKNVVVTSAATDKLKEVLRFTKPEPLEVVEEIQDGMQELLRIHPPKELRALCNVTGVGAGGTSKAMRQRLFDDYLHNLDTYKTLMSVMYEATMITYLRQIGFPMKKGKADPRNLVMKHWMTMRVPQQQPHTDVLIPRTVRHSKFQMTQDPIVGSFLRELRLHELKIKDGEIELRCGGGKNLDNVIEFFSNVHKLRVCESKGRKYLLDTAQTLSAKQYHVDRALLMTQDRMQNLATTHQSLHEKQTLNKARDGAVLQMYFQNLGQSAVLKRDCEYKWFRAKQRIDEKAEIYQRHKKLSTEALRKSLASCKNSGNVMADIKAQIEDMEGKLAVNTGKFEELQDRLVTYGASDEFTADFYVQQASDLAMKNEDHKNNIHDVSSLLLEMLRQDKPSAKADGNVFVEYAEELILTLGITNSQGLVEKKEHILMWKEEMAMLKQAAMKEAKAKKKKKKKGKKVKSKRELRAAAMAKELKKRAKKKKKKGGKAKGGTKKKGKGKKKK
jgi:hypothetical protein